MNNEKKIVRKQGTMKTLRPLMVLSAFLLIVSQGIAQEFRLSAGYNGSNLSGSETEGWTGKAGYQFGADVLFGDQFYVRTGAQFLVRNLNYSYSPPIDDGLPDLVDQEFKYTSRLLRVPVNAGVRLFDPKDEPKVNAYAIVGPSVLFNLKTELNSEELNVETSDAQWYIGFGAGAEISFVFVEAGYDVALSKALDSEFTEAKVNFLYVMVGARLRLAK